MLKQKRERERKKTSFYHARTHHTLIIKCRDKYNTFSNLKLIQLKERREEQIEVTIFIKTKKKYIIKSNIPKKRKTKEKLLLLISGNQYRSLGKLTIRKKKIQIVSYYLKKKIIIVTKSSFGLFFLNFVNKHTERRDINIGNVGWRLKHRRQQTLEKQLSQFKCRVEE